MYVTYADGVVVNDGDTFLSSLELLESEAASDVSEVDRDVLLRAQLLLFRSASTEEVEAWARREYFRQGADAQRTLTFEDLVARGWHLKELARQCAGG
ncbi:MAG: hypothetical protein U0514_00605 [Candidatus Andersenbacteria bacterium]